jgi:hypothetical protein
MGLLNVYQMRTMRPYINYRFKCNIWPFDGGFVNSNPYYEYTIKKVKLPTFKLNTENKISFGNTAFVIPIIDFGDTSLDITFEEDDVMNVFELLCGFYGKDTYKSAKMQLVCVKIDQFDETMINLVDSKLYLCRMKEFSQPSFNNNGRGAPVEITASFNVVYIYQGDASESGFDYNYKSDSITRPEDDNEKYFEEEMKKQSKTAEEVYKKKEEEQKQRMLKYVQDSYIKYKDKAVSNLHKETLKKEKEKFTAANEALEQYTNIVFNAIISKENSNKGIKEWSDRIKQERISVSGEKPKTDFEILADILDVDLSDGIDSSEKNSLLEFYGANEEESKLLSQVIDKYSDAKINTNLLSEAESGKEEDALKTVFENNGQSYDNELLREEINLSIKDSNNSSDPERALRAKSPKTQAIQDAEKEAAAATGVSYLAIAMANGGESALYGKGFEERKDITAEEKTEAKRIQSELDKLPYGNLLQEFVADLSEKQYWYGHKAKNGDLSSVIGLDCSAAMSAWATQVGYTIDQRDAGAKSGGLVRQLVAQGAEDVGKNYDTGLVPGDILNKSSTKEGNSGHVVMFLGYDNNGNMLVAESSGRTNEDKATDEWISSGGRVRRVSIEKMKNEGYIGVKIMNNPNIKHNF